jgi:Pyridoxamine 5'-phosphate oxidase
MARTHDTLDENLRGWVAAQHLFFVGSAPSGGDGHVNLSPKGYDTFRILDDTTVAYLDLTGSGVETIAHLRDNGRLTIMFCAFEGPPRILRLFGQGDVVLPGDLDFDELRAGFGDVPGVRSIIRCRLERIQSSCGYSVPFMAYESERETLLEWADRKSPEELGEYHAEKNAESIDGLAGLVP